MNKRSSKWLHPTRKRDQRLTTQVTAQTSAGSTAVFGSLKCCIVVVQGMPCRLSECETFDFSCAKIHNLWNKPKAKLDKEKEYNSIVS